MPVLSRGVVARTFQAPACLLACLLLLLLLLLLKRVAHPWPLKGGVKPRQGKPSSVIIRIVLRMHQCHRQALLLIIIVSSSKRSNISLFMVSLPFITRGSSPMSLYCFQGSCGSPAIYFFGLTPQVL